MYRCPLFSQAWKKSVFSVYRDVNQLLQLRQGEQEAAGLGEGPGGLHAGQQLEEDEEAAAAQKE